MPLRPHPNGPLLHRANRVEELGEAFLHLLRNEALRDPFQSETILVGSTGLRDWLRKRVADDLGIAAHLSFVYPGTLSAWLHQAHALRTVDGLQTAAAQHPDTRAVHGDPATQHPDTASQREKAANLRGDAGADLRRAPDSEEETPWVPDRLVWVVAAELLAWREGPPTDRAAGRLHAYLQAIETEGDAPGTLSAPLFALATEVSRLFLRYHAWRPEMVAAWATGRDLHTTRQGGLAPFAGPSADLAWQPLLWRRVRDRLARRGAADPLQELGLPPGATRQPLFRADTLSPDPALTDALRGVLPPRLSLFGVSSLNPLQLLALTRIAQAIPVHWFLTAPTPFWLGDQTLRAAADQDQRRSALLHNADAGATRRTYIEDPRDRAAQGEGTQGSGGDAWRGSETESTSEGAGGDGIAPAAGADLDATLPEHRDFDDLEGHVCPLVAAFGRVARASQLLLEERMPSAPDGRSPFVHPLLGVQTYTARTSEGEAQRTPTPTAGVGGGAGEAGGTRGTEGGNNSPMPSGNADSASAPPSLLHRLQADVYMLESAAYAVDGVAGSPFRHDIDAAEPVVSRRGERAIAPTDRSLGFHACYGPSRQVDAVRDLIVDALASDPTLRPGDIAVMTPDIAAHAPLIEATFLQHAPRSNSLERTGIPGIPIRIQDRAIRSTNPVAAVLLSLLALAEGRRRVTDVLALLGQEPVHTHFGLARDELARIEEWLRKAGARWGVDAADQRHETHTPTNTHDASPDSRLRHTLLAALERLALGAVMPLEAVPLENLSNSAGGLSNHAGDPSNLSGGAGDTTGGPAHITGGTAHTAPNRSGRDAAPPNTYAAVHRPDGLPVFPLDEAGDRDLAARAVLFLETLLDTLDALREPRPLEDWLDLFAREDREHPGLLQRFVTLPQSRAWQKAQVMDELAALARDSAALGLNAVATDATDATDATHASGAPANTADQTKRAVPGAQSQGGAGRNATPPAMPIRIAPAAMAAWMRSRMDRADRRVSDGLDAVTFCSLMPVRSVPYRWILLLGVDAEIFPRAGTRPAWDLIARAPRPWDRNPRDEDRALFLDALLSAREACHIFYTGRTPQRNEEVAPAAPVAQLMEMLDRRFAPPAEGPTASAWLTRHYPLQPFSERNFRQDRAEREGRLAPRPPVHHRGEHRAARSLIQGRGDSGPWTMEIPWDAPPALPRSLREQKPIVLELDALAKFHEDPLAAWLGEVAGLRWPKKEEDAPDDLLPTEIPTLDRLTLMRQATELELAWSPELASTFATLPIGSDGERCGSALFAKVAQLRALLGEHFGQTRPLRLEVRLRLDDVVGCDGPVEVVLRGNATLAHWKDGRRPPALLDTQFSAVRAKHALQAWLRLLAALAGDPQGIPAAGGLVIGVAPHRDDQAVSLHALSLRELGTDPQRDDLRAWARAALEDRVRAWMEGLARPMPVLPNDGTKVVEQGRSALAARYEGGPAGSLGGKHSEAVGDGSSLLADALGLSRRPLDPKRDADLLRVMRGAARGTWNQDAFLRGGQKLFADTENPLLRRIFGEEGPAQRWPEAFVHDCWRVFLPGVALADALRADQNTQEQPFATWATGGQP